MADISKINPNGTEYNIKDAVARGMMAGSQTVTGNPITITDGSETYADELVVDLEPIQSGSGTPSPSNVRPIQGYDIVSVDRCGKNFVEETLIKFTITNTGLITLDSNNTFDMQIAKIRKGETYTITTDDIFCVGYFTQKPANGVYSYDGERHVNSTLRTFVAPIDGYVAFRTLTGYTTPQIEIGSTATTYEPYNGQTVSLQLGNKNLLPMTVEGIKGTDQDSTWSGNSLTTNGVTFTIVTDSNGVVTKIHAKRNSASSSIAWLNLCVGLQLSGGCIVNGGINANTAYIRIGEATSATSTGSSKAESTGGDASFIADSSKYYAASIGIKSGFSGEADIYPMLRSATVTDPTFSPYDPTLGDMVYGATVNVANGTMVVDKVTKTYDGSESWNHTANSGVNYLSPRPSNMKSPSNYAISNQYEKQSTFDQNANGFYIGTSFNVIDTVNGTTLDGWKTYLSNHNLQVCYELETPITYHLTPAQLKLLKGYNYITSNGTTIHLTYQPDNAVGDAVSKAEKYTDRLCKTGVVDTFNLYNGNTKVGSVSLLSNGFKLLYISSIDDGSVFGMNIPDKYVPKGPYQRAVICFEDSYANPRIIEIYQNHITVTEDKFEHGDTYGTGLYY